MAVIRANRESIDDRFSVLGFTVRSELPLFEIGIATDPDLLKPEHRAKRTPRNFFTSRLLRASPSQRGEAVYLVPPEVVSRFVGQQRLYFGLATYRENDRSTPISLRIPDRGTMYVSVSGLTERGLRRTVRGSAISAYSSTGYGSNGEELDWGGDAAGTPSSHNEDHAQRKGNGANAGVGSNDTPGYSDGYSDDLWHQTPAAATVPAPEPVAAPAPAPASSSAPAAEGLALRNDHRPVAARSLLISSDYRPTNLFEALRAQLGFFLDSAMWYLGVSNTQVMPHSATCQIRRPDGSVEGALHGSGFFIGPRLIMTAAHVVDGQSQLIVVPGKNGGGTGSATEPFGRFTVTTFRKHGSYGTNGSDYDMALIQVPAANSVGSGRYFDRVEELTQSRPEGVVVGGYAARWYANDLIEHFVNETIDPNRQHMMGGYILELPTDETFSYNIQTLGGTSGSPVYWIEDTSAGPQAHLVGVHVAAHDSTTNLGCRVTAGKLTWIRSVAAEWGQTLTFSMGPRARSLSAVDNDSGNGYGEGGGGDHTADTDADAMAIDGDIPDDEAASQAQSWYTRALDVPSAPEYPLAQAFAPAHPNNYTVGRNGTAIDLIVIHITGTRNDYDRTVRWFQTPNQVMGRNRRRVRVSAHYVVGRGGEVVQMVAHADTAHHAHGVNRRSIGIEHNATAAGGHVPTNVQYRNSAKLVAWLCVQLGIPADRSHVLGHSEVDASTTHTSCPNSVWDWDTYMGYVAAEAAALSGGGAAAQSLGLRRAYAAAQEIITPYYDPADSASALTCQADAFSQAREEWFAGVPNTTIFPHSAICLLEMQDAAGHVARGTGFYIGRNRILTCAHNLYNRASVTIIPGKNGNGGTVTEPFGRTTVTSSSWRIPASYAGSNRGTDLAVIENVPIEAPNGQWFDQLEELTQSRPEGVVVCGYSSRSERVPELTRAIDGFRQHLHAGYIATLADDDSTFSYPILTLKRASGSPVYYISNKSGTLRSYVVGVHTASDSDDLNRGCRLMRNKIDWIEGRTTSLSLSNQSRARSRALGNAFSLHWPDVPMTYQTSPMSCWAAAASMVVGWRDLMSIPDSAIAEKVPVFEAFRNGLYGHERGLVADAWNLMAEAPASYTIEAWRDMLANNGPLYIDQVADAATGGGHVRVLVGITSGGAADGSDTVMYMHDPARGQIKLSFADFLALYEGRTANTGGYLQFQIMHSDGIPDARSASSTAAFSLGATPARAQAYDLALGNDGPSDIPVHLIPQPDKNACWAAAMAMLLAHRGRQSRTPESIINDVGGTLASSYGWDLLQAVRDRYGFEVIDEPSNASLYHTPRQWAEWLKTYGPLWVVIVGAPHAVVVAGIRGDLGDPNATQVKILNPWDTRVAFDNDPVAFHPANNGYEDWLPFAEFAGDFGTMAQPDYGNWRILHLPASAAQSLSMEGRVVRLASPPPPVRAFGAASAGERRAPIEPSRVLGTTMQCVIGEAGVNRWALDQLAGMKPSAAAATPDAGTGNGTPADAHIDIDDWPAIEGSPTPLPLKIDFRTANGAIGDVRIAAGTPANLAYGVEVVARIEDCADADGVARLRIRIDYRFRGLSQGNPDAYIELCLRGDGRHERANGWRNADVLSPAA
jgi:V8-like Glu-specific endopeptidase/N-acetyl-anhydromuramyl-L-alanine amidase AmpD